MKYRMSLAFGGVLLMAGSLTSSALDKALKADGNMRTGESVSPSNFQHCDFHIEDTIPGPETKMDVNVPAITGAQTVDKIHSIDAWITRT